MLVAAVIGALLGVDSGRVMPLDPATLRPTARGEAIGPMRGPVAWSPDRQRLAIAVRPAGRVQIVGERTVDTGTDAALLAWAGRRLVAVGSDGAVAGGKVRTPVETAVSAGERAVVLSRESLAFIAPDGAVRQVAVARRGPRRARRVVACRVRRGRPGRARGDAGRDRHAAHRHRARLEGLPAVPDGGADRRHAGRLGVRQGHPRPLPAAVRAAALRHATLDLARARRTRLVVQARRPPHRRRAGWPARLHGGRDPAPPRVRRPRQSSRRSAPHMCTRTSSARSAAGPARSICAPARRGCSRRGSRTCCEMVPLRGGRARRVRRHGSAARDPHAGAALAAVPSRSPPSATARSTSSSATATAPRRLTQRQARRVLAQLVGSDLIAYRVNPPRDDAGDIWTMRPDGTGKRNLTRSPGVPDWSPSFSPDGRMIAFGGHRGGDFDIPRSTRRAARSEPHQHPERR